MTRMAVDEVSLLASLNDVLSSSFYGDIRSSAREEFRVWFNV